MTDITDDVLPELPEELGAVRCMIRGEMDYSEAGDYYYTRQQMRDYARAALAASRAEVEGLRKDAERWRYARRILPVLYIEESHDKYVLWCRSDDESENLKADVAIDAAMENNNG